jgi:hypothetical protein
LEFYYFIDWTGTAFFSTNVTAFLPALNVNFPTSAGAVGGTPVDGTATSNQRNLRLFDQLIADWPPGAALWLVWEMADPAGKSQGLAIDNLSFSASDQQSVGSEPNLTAQISGANLFINWLSLSGTSYQMEFTDDLASGAWTALGAPIIGTGAVLTFTNSVGASAQRFYRLQVLP